ncbi:hypothetical protein BLIJ_1845 [Bifidobacterium longum subsp. infantis ATCC 15697 = JCM 1222 = DSM 20088]|nr:hypothetical protein BLIJ_1845 [Bifidobacterium longum subsp. infantis ATCC 15697 = JCM 1222 = DSM 20088]
MLIPSAVTENAGPSPLFVTITTIVVFDFRILLPAACTCATGIGSIMTSAVDVTLTVHSASTLFLIDHQRLKIVRQIVIAVNTNPISTDGVLLTSIMNVPQLIILPSVGRVLNVAVPSLPAEGPYTEREKHERQRVWPPRGWLPEGRWWPVTQIHARASGLRRRARLLRRLDSKPCGLRASHRQRFGRAHGLRVRSTQTDRTGVERGGHRISLAGRRRKPAGQAEGKPNNPR